jgi:diguanylate cyclase (GGDEF)-like protein
MLANLLSLLDRNAEPIWLGALLLALAFRRNRFALALVVIGAALYMSAQGNVGMQFAAALLMLLVVAMPEPSIRSLRSGLVVLSAVALPWMPDYAPALTAALGQSSNATLAISPGFGGAAWVIAFASAFTLVRWLHRGWPLDLYFAFALLPAIIAWSAAPSHSMSGWLAACAGAMAIAVLYGAYRMAFIDALTGLPNRRALDERLARSPGRIAVGMVDVDHFKRFNDRYGHEAGDRVLKVVARELRRVRGGTAYRYGGEEFSIVFEGRSAEQASDALETVRTAVEAARVKLGRSGGGKRAQAVRKGQGDGDVGVTVSMGLAEREPGRRSAEAIIDAADKALYRSKQRGRNRLTLANASRT